MIPGTMNDDSEPRISNLVSGVFGLDFGSYTILYRLIAINTVRCAARTVFITSSRTDGDTVCLESRQNDTASDRGW